MSEKQLKEKIYSVRLTEEQAVLVKELAKRENRTVSNMIYNIVVLYLSALDESGELMQTEHA
jgi:hypothetical protein